MVLDIHDAPSPAALIKPRIAPEDDEAAHALMCMGGLVSKELFSQGTSEEAAVTAVVAASTAPSADDVSSHKSSSRDDGSSSSAADSLEDMRWSKNPTRTVSIDEDAVAASAAAAADASSPPPPVQFVDLHFPYSNAHRQYRHEYQTSSATTPVQSALFQQQQVQYNHQHMLLHRPAVITPVRSMGRPLMTMTMPASSHSMMNHHRLQQHPFAARPTLPNLTPSLSAFWAPPAQAAAAAPLRESQAAAAMAERFAPRTTTATSSHFTTTTTTLPPFAMELEIPQGFPKLPPLLSMKRDKMRNKMRLQQQQEEQQEYLLQRQDSNVSSTSFDERCCSSSNSSVDERSTAGSSHSSNNNNDDSHDDHHPVVAPSTNKEQEHVIITPTTPKKVKADGLLRKSPLRKGGKKFSWKSYPELEDFLIANRPEYLRHSAQNYTLEQKDYNNTLTARLVEYAEQCGYGKLLDDVYKQDFGSFTAIRDRIRGYYKSFLQSSRRREQRRQRRMDKQRQQLHHRRGELSA